MPPFRSPESWLAQALMQADRAGRVAPGRAHEQDAKFVGFELFIRK